MRQNAYLLAKIGADAAENERKLAEILPKIGNYPTVQVPGLRVGDDRREEGQRADVHGPGDLEVAKELWRSVSKR